VFLLDTHAWVWLFGRDPRAADVGDLPDDSTFAISGISLWEAAMLDAGGRVRLLPDCGSWLHEATESLGVRVLPITTEIACACVALPDGFPRDPADRIIAATALHANAELITADRGIIEVAPQAGLRVRPLSSRKK